MGQTNFFGKIYDRLQILPIFAACFDGNGFLLDKCMLDTLF